MPDILARVISSFMKFFFHHLYHGLAGGYDFVADVVSLGRWNDWIFTLLPYLQSGPVLEIGHGPGHLQKRLLSEGSFAVGLDESRQMSALARKRLDGLPFCLVRADAGALPFTAGVFPAIAATFPSDFILAPRTLSEISRVMTSTGQVVILLAAWPGGSSLPEKAMRLLFRVTGESPDVNFDFSRIISFCEENGFSARFEIANFEKSRLLLVFLNKITSK